MLKVIIHVFIVTRLGSRMLTWINYFSLFEWFGGKIELIFNLFDDNSSLYC
jgi:hypothetical protein